MIKPPWPSLTIQASLLLDNLYPKTMAAAASIGIYSISSSINTIKYHRKHTNPSSLLIHSSSSRSLQVRLMINQAHAFVNGSRDDKQRVIAEAALEAQVEDSTVPAGTTKVYFGNLPYNVDSSILAGIVQPYATPELIEVLYDRNSGRSRGFAFVTMSSIEDANFIVQKLEGTEYGGRILRVNLSDKPQAKEALYPETEHKLFVGNISWSVTSETLKTVFQEYGNVVGARVLYDGESGRSRGYGFVCYSSATEMENALASLNGLELEGRAIRVYVANRPS